MKEEIRRILSQRERLTLSPLGRSQAAVLLLLYEKQDEYHVLFTQRTERVEHHKGQVSFPGGAFHPDDQRLETTALRESFEEIGVKREDVEILGELDDTLTVTSNFIITPFVGAMPYPYEFTLNREEIEEVFDVPISALLDKERFREEVFEHEGQPHPVYYYEYEGRVIWGATARILKQFLELVLSNKP